MHALVFVLLMPAQAPGSSEEEMVVHLLKVRRLYVEKLGGGEAADHIRDMIIGSLQKSGLFILTENQERADAYLRGSAEDLIFTETFQSSEGVDARVSGGLSLGGTTRSSSRRAGSFSAGAGDNESTRIAERKHEATAAVRIVNKEGDVIWSTTQESMGAKFRGAGSDTADKITKQLMADFDRARRLRPASK